MPLFACVELGISGLLQEHVGFMEVNHPECLSCYSVPARPYNQRKRKAIGELNGTVNKLALYSRSHKSPTTARFSKCPKEDFLHLSKVNTMQDAFPPKFNKKMFKRNLTVGNLKLLSL